MHAPVSPLSRLPLASLLGSAILASAAFSPAAPGQAPSDAPAMLGSAFFDWDKLPVKATPVGALRAVVDAPTPTFGRLEIHATTLHPGYASHPPHHHPQEELILIKEGTLESWINGRRERAGAGSLVFFASHDVHNLTNIGDGPATYYVINFYTPATASVRDRPAAEWAPSDKLRSGVIDWEKLVPEPTATGVRRSLVNASTLTLATLEVHATTLAPDAPPSRPHRRPWSTLVIVKEGRIDATVDGITHLAGPGSIVFMASNAMQSMGNPGPLPATYFVFSVSSEATPAATD